MKNIIPVFLLVLTATLVCGCSFHSYQSAITEIEIPHYRKPDSLNVVDERTLHRIDDMAGLLSRQEFECTD